MPRLGQVRNVGEAPGVKGRLQSCNGKPQNYSTFALTVLVSSSASLASYSSHHLVKFGILQCDLVLPFLLLFVIAVSLLLISCT
jgi:hypothetical protein